jgi:hypothetical protein
VDDGLPLHAAVSRATLTVATMAVAVRTADGHARGGRRMTRAGSAGIGFMPAIQRRAG